MPFPSYLIKIYHPTTGALLDILALTNAYSLRYGRQLNDIGSFALSLPDDRDFTSILIDDAFIDIEREAPDGTMQVESTYLLQSITRFETERSSRIVVSGMHLNSLLARREVDPRDDSVQPNGGYATKAGNAANVIRAYIREQCGDLASAARQFPRLTVPAPIVSGNGVGANLRYQNLLEEIKKLTVTGGIDFEMRHINGTGELQCFVGIIGDDKSIETNLFPPYTVFNPMRGNLTDPKLTIDRTKEVTFIYAGGDGEGANRTIIDVPSSAAADSPYHRIEKFVDIRTTEKKGDAYQLYIGALKKLEENKKKIEFEFELVLTTGGGIYRTDWEFGDVVTVSWKDTQYQLRISEMEFNIDSKGEDIKVKLDNSAI